MYGNHCVHAGINGQDDQQDWALSNFNTATNEMPLDHTTGSPGGHYGLLWANGSTHVGDTAWLLSKAIVPVASDSGCNVRFYYYIFGTNNHRIDVKVRQAGIR
jgi:hypothetical protein